MSFLPMAGTAIKNLFSRPATRLYPFATRAPFAGTRGNISIEFAQCIFCGMCARRCPAHAIAVSREKKEWRMDRLSCVICANCVAVCPKKCLRLEGEAAKSVPSARRLEQTETHSAEAVGGEAAGNA